MLLFSSLGNVVFVKLYAEVRIIIILKINYAKIEFLSISGMIFYPASGGFVPDYHRGSAPGPDLPLLCKLHDNFLV